MNLYEENKILKLTKFDVAERQLFQAIKMFFNNEDEVSIHTLTEASAQIFKDIGKPLGIKSMIRDSGLIRPERKKEWLKAMSSSKNFFKHADKDPDDIHEFKSMFNDFSILDAVNMYGLLKKRRTPETLIFYCWFALAYPDLVKESTDLDEFIHRVNSRSDSPDPNDKHWFGDVIHKLRSGEFNLPNVVLTNGL